MTSVDLNDSWVLYFKERVEEPPVSLQAAVDAGYERVQAQVPGSVEIDLMQAGYLPDLYVEANIERARDLEYGDWWYARSFDLPDGWPTDSETCLVLDGVDTIAEVFCNGQRLAELDNMLIPHEIPVTNLAAEHNELVVHISSVLRHAEQFSYAPQYHGPLGHREALWVRKAQHMYGWDIAPRLVSAGIWRGVTLITKPRCRLTGLYIYTESINSSTNTAALGVDYTISDAPRGADWRLEVTIVDPDGEQSCQTVHQIRFSSSEIHAVTIKDPQLWWPRGLGPAALYKVTVRLLVDGEVADSRVEMIGIRRIAVEYVDAPPPEGTMRIRVNDVPIMLLGTNWVPLDALHGRDGDRLAAALEVLGDVGCNAVRCWGGSVYESDEFFSWCDQHGVLVWQDFALACGLYPQEESFLSALRIEAASVITRLRNHASLMLWCGNNENDANYLIAGLDPNEVDLTSRQVLSAAVHRLDPERAYLPSSPYFGPGMLAASKRPQEPDWVWPQPPDWHLWPGQQYFKGGEYADVTTALLSEIGFSGCPSARTLREFLAADQTHVDPDNDIWRLHDTTELGSEIAQRGNRTQGMIDQTEALFGPVPRDLEGFAAASQIAQAEALKFIVESTRLAKPQRTGVLWWNLLDCWPGLSHAVVDYYFRKKLAYYFLQRVQHPVCLMAAEESGSERAAVIANDTLAPVDVSYQISELATNTVLLAGSAVVPAGENLCVGSIPFSGTGPRCLGLTWQYAEETHGNHYVEDGPPLDLAQYLTEWLPAISSLGSQPIPIKSLWT